MKKKFTKAAALFLAFTMCIGMIPAFASEQESVLDDLAVSTEESSEEVSSFEEPLYEEPTEGTWLEETEAEQLLTEDESSEEYLPEPVEEPIMPEEEADISGEAEVQEEPSMNEEAPAEPVTSEESANESGAEDEQPLTEDESSEEYLPAPVEEPAPEAPETETEPEQIPETDDLTEEPVIHEPSIEIETEETITEEETSEEETSEEEQEEEDDDLELMDVAASGTCGEGVTWVLDDAGTLTISGSGQMDNYTHNGRRPWDGYRSNILHIVVEDGVTSIGNYALIYCNNTTDITIADTVTSIGSGAFFMCESLTQITIPASVTELDSGAFQICRELTEITIPASVVSLGDHLFEGSPITYFAVDSGNPVYDSRDNCNAIIETATGTLLYGCVNTIIPSGVKKIGTNAFDKCKGLENIVIPEGLTEIGVYGFAMCENLNSIEIPSSVTKIGAGAFLDCDNLTDVYYSGTKLQWANIVKEPDNDCLIGAAVHCSDGLYDLNIQGGGYFGENLTWILDEDGTLTISGNGAIPDYTAVFNSDNNAPWYSRRDLITRIIVEEGVTSIGRYAFSESGAVNHFITEVTIPESVKKIANSAFDADTKLTDVYYSGTKVQWAVLSKGSYNDPLINAAVHCSDGLYDLPGGGTCGENLMWVLDLDGILTIFGSGNMNNYYAYAPSLAPWNSMNQLIRQIVIEEGVNSIGNYAFDQCSSFSDIQIAGSVTRIGSYAFRGCSGLTAVTIPEGVTRIQNYAFQNCNNLETLTIPASVISLGEEMISGCSSLRNLVVESGNSKYDSRDNCNAIIETATNTLLWGCAGTVIPSGVISLGIRAFAGCTMTDMTIPEGVISIGTSAFENSSLTEITIPASVKRILTNAFYNCGNLTDVYFSGTKVQWAVVSKDGSGLDNVSVHCSDGLYDLDLYNAGITANGLAWVLHKDGLLEISGEGNMDNYSYSSSPWFNYYGQITSVEIEEGITSIGNYAFYNHTSLVHVTLPDSLTSVGSSAFYRCLQLTDLVIPSGVTNIMASAFSGCTKLSSLQLPSSLALIDANAFLGCMKLAEVSYPETREKWDEVSVHSTGNKFLTAAVRCADSADMEWSVSEDGVLNVAVSGEMDNFTSSEGNYIAPWYPQREEIRMAVMGSGVTRVGNYAFSDCINLASIELPDSVTGIEENTFDGCDSLSDLYFTGDIREWLGKTEVNSDPGFQNLSFHFSISTDLSEVQVSGIEDKVFSGQDLTQNLTLTMDGWGTLIEGTDYTLEYTGNRNVGTAIVKITGIGNFSGSIQETFAITEKPVIPVVELSKVNLPYNGGVQTPKVTVKDGSTVLEESEDYTVAFSNPASTNVGTYQVTVTLKGNYSGTATASYKIAAKAITPVVTLSATSFTYTGKEQKPSVTAVKDGTAALAETDYTVTYEAASTDAGTYQVTVTLKGNYSGTATASYKIAAKTITPTVSLSAKSFEYNGKVHKPTVTVKDGTEVLAADNYDVTFTGECKNAGKYKVTVKLKGNYSGNRTVSFKITKAKNPMTVKTAKKTVKYATVKKKAVTIKPITVKKAKGTVTYKKTKGNSKITVNSKTGKITVKKGLKKGTYTVKVKITAKGTSNYEKLVRTETVKIVVK